MKNLVLASRGITLNNFEDWLMQETDVLGIDPFLTKEAKENLAKHHLNKLKVLKNQLTKHLVFILSDQDHYNITKLL